MMTIVALTESPTIYLGFHGSIMQLLGSITQLPGSITQHLFKNVGENRKFNEFPLNLGGISYFFMDLN